MRMVLGGYFHARLCDGSVGVSTGKDEPGDGGMITRLIRQIEKPRRKANEKEAIVLKASGWPLFLPPLSTIDWRDSEMASPELS
jgi:hypothetical protein